MAEDNGEPRRSAQASLSVNIVNVNDNPPQFTNASYHETISEDTRIGTTILVVSAIDPDGLDEDFQYSIERYGYDESGFKHKNNINHGVYFSGNFDERGVKRVFSRYIFGYGMPS